MRMILANASLWTAATTWPSNSRSSAIILAETSHYKGLRGSVDKVIEWFHILDAQFRL